MTEIEVVELEEERTIITGVNGATGKFKLPITLKKGDTLRLQVRTGEVVQLTGTYIPDGQKTGLNPNPTRRNQLISQWMTTSRRSDSGQLLDGDAPRSPHVFARDYCGYYDEGILSAGIVKRHGAGTDPPTLRVHRP